MALKETFKALGDPARREILEMLKAGPMCAGDIAERFNTSQPTVSYHLAQLKRAGLVRETREKNYIYYALNASVFEEMLLWLRQFHSREEETHDEAQ